MRRLLLALALISATQARAGDVRFTAGQSSRLSVTGLTAAYSIDPDCAELRVEEGQLLISGRRACNTHIVIVGDKVSSIEVAVLPKERDARLMLEARRRTIGIQEHASISTSYFSDTAESQTTFEMGHSEGQRSTTALFTFANGYGFIRSRRRSAIPQASIQFVAPGTRITLLDARVEDSPLTIESTVIRGFHIDTGNWFAHAGLASLSGFRGELFETDSDRVGEIGNRHQFSPHGTLTSSVQWVSASKLYLSGRSGAIGSLKYDYALAGRFHVMGQVGGSRGIGGSGTLNYTGLSTNLAFTARFMPRNFAALSTATGPGFNADLSLTRRLTEQVGMEFHASRNSYTILNGGSQVIEASGASIRWKPVRFISGSAGVSISEFSRPIDPTIHSLSLPLGVSLESHRIGNSFLYEFTRNRASSGSNSFRDALRINLGRITLSATATRKTQVPTLDFLLEDVPLLRQALLAAGVVVTTPEQLEEFIRNNTDLITSGALRNVRLGITPVRDELSGAIQWKPMRMLDARYEWRQTSDQRISSERSYRTHDARLALRLGDDADLSFGILQSQAAISGSAPVNDSVVMVGLTKRFRNAPTNLLPLIGGGRISGVVYSVSKQANTLGAGISGVQVVLDGNQRTQTDKRGHYSFRSLSPGKHTLDVAYSRPQPYVFATPPHVEVEDDAVVNFGIGAPRATIYGSVSSDAGKPLGGVRLRLSGTDSRETTTSSSGVFLINDLDSGSYSITVVPDSLPASYSLSSLDEVTTSTEPSQAGRVAFVVRAHRSLSGRVICHGGSIENVEVNVASDSGSRKVDFDSQGRFVIRNLAYGPHLLTVQYNGYKISRTVDVPAEPATLDAGDLNVCSETNR